MAAIELEGVTKRFGDVTALDDVNLTVEEEEIFGFLGPNGAGKSTTIDILLDFVRPTEGRAKALGFDAQRESLAIRKRTGVLPDACQVYNRLTGRQHVQFAIDSKGVDDGPEALLARVGIQDAADRPAGDYSQGMRQRLVLAMALVGEPALLVLDEPTTGLDPNGAREIRRMIREERDRGATVFFSSHILEQVEAICDRVAILNRGRIVAVDTIEGLRKASGASEALSIAVDLIPEGVIEAVEAVEGIRSVGVEGDVVTVHTDGGNKTAILHALEDCGAEIRDFTTQGTSLEKLFAHYTKHQETVVTGGDSS
ncbi:ABC transporter ATP-binding protein [Salinibacter altiplanensis]|uniref:ABC transporter ATP-binding protein n=1 Tax=Salinibacter altiplanensis TaxID=1803181 RepID=UPI000C9F8762|nr:ABC transporter ATP-binding protein [Salinibacter altiplanensis]